MVNQDKMSPFIKPPGQNVSLNLGIPGQYVLELGQYVTGTICRRTKCILGQNVSGQNVP